MTPDATSGEPAARKKPFPPGFLLAGGVLVLAALAAYHNSFSGPFILDDLPSIVENPTIRQLWPLWPVLSPPSFSGAGGRPLINVLFALNHAFGGMAVQGYHALNLAIHVCAGLTLLGLVRRTLLQPALRERFGTAALPLALTVALLWTLHPLQTESVTYIVQRVESLMGLFYLLTLYCFVRGTESPAGAQARGRFDGPFDRLRAPSWSKGRFDKLKALSQSKGWLALAVAACWLGMCCKEVMVTAPLLVLLYDRTFVAGTFREAWRQRRGLYLGLAGAWLLLGFLMLDISNRGVGYGLGVTWWSYALTECRAIIVHYLGLAIWPHPLVLDYGGMALMKQAKEAAPYALVLLLLVTGVAILLRRRPVLGFATGWIYLILAPGSSVVPLAGQPIAEHRMYVSLAGVIALGVLGLYAATGRRSLYACLALAVGLGWLTARRNEDYRSDLAIWGDTVTKRPDNARALTNLGFYLIQAGRLSEAMEYCEKALRIDPDDSDVRNNLGSALFKAGRVPEAIRHYREAIRLKPGDAVAQNNLAYALAQTGKGPEAIRHYEVALRIRPDFAEAHFNLGSALMQAGRVAEAARHFEKAVQIQPDDAQAQNNFGLALAQTNRTTEAVEHYREAVRLKPGYAEAHFNLGNALLSLGRAAQASGSYEEAVRLRPGYADAHNNLGTALLQTGRAVEAREHFKTAVRLKPGYADAHSNLGYVLGQEGRVTEAIDQYEEVLRIEPANVEVRDNLDKLLALKQMPGSNQ